MEIRTTDHAPARAAPFQDALSKTAASTLPDAAAIQTVRAASAIEESQRIRQEKPEADAVKEAVENLSASLESIPSDLQFVVDEDLGEVVVRMIDPQTKEVLKQIPSETVLNIAKSINNLTGKLIREKA